MADGNELKTNLQTQIELQPGTARNDAQNQIEIKTIDIPKDNMTIETDDMEENKYSSDDIVTRETAKTVTRDEHDDRDIDDEEDEGYDNGAGWPYDIDDIGTTLWYVGDIGYEKLHYQLTNYFEKKKEKYWKCAMRNDPRNKDFYNEWPRIVYISEDQCKQLPFIHPQSIYSRSLLYEYWLYIPHKGYAFYFGDKSDELIYIVNDVKFIEDKDDIDNGGYEIFKCLRINLNNDINNEYPECIYLTKQQFNDIKQLLGLDLLRKRAIFDKQQAEINKLNELKVESPRDNMKRKEKMKLLRSEYTGFAFAIKEYTSDGSQVVYYVDDIRGADIRFVCILSNKNGFDKLAADLPYEPVIELNENEIRELEENDAFKGNGYRLHFDEDIYSLYASFYLSKKNPSYYLCGVTTFTFLLQLISFLAIIWCFDVSYTEDVIKEYKIGTFQQCGLETTIFTDNMNDTDITTGCVTLNPDWYKNTSYLNTLKHFNAQIPKNILTLREDNASTQRFEDTQSWWYIAGYVGTAFTSILILTCYVYKAMISPLKLLVSYKYVDMIYSKQKKRIQWLSVANLFLILFAYAIGCWSIVTYPENIGIATPFDVLALPISIVFVLEIDDWIYHIMKIAYCEHIESNGFVEVTATGLADFGARSSKWTYWLVTCQFWSSYAGVAAAWFGDPPPRVSGDVLDINNQVTLAIAAFMIIVYAGAILLDKYNEKFEDQMEVAELA